MHPHVRRPWFGFILFTLALAALPAHADSARFPVAKVEVADRSALSSVLSGKAYATKPGRWAYRSLGRGGVRIAKHLHLLMHQGVDAYDKVVLTPNVVALVRKDGLVDVIRRADAEAQVATGKPVGQERVAVGAKARGMTVWAEAGPGDTFRLYRQLPVAANGEIASSHSGYTSFALSHGDAFHPFGTAGKTVTLSVPRTLFNRAANGELGGAGFTHSPGAHTLGIDVVEEIQIDSAHVKDVTR